MPIRSRIGDGGMRVDAPAEALSAEDARGLPWGVNLVLAVTMFVVGSDLYIVAPLLVPIAHTYRVAIPETGLLVTAFSALYAVASPLIGWISDVVDRRLVLYSGMVAFIVFEVASALAPSFAWMMVARALTGAATAAITPTAYAILGDVVPFRYRGRAMALASMGFSGATFAGVPIGLWLSHWWSWRGVLVALGVGSLALGIPLVWILERALAGGAEPRPKAPVGGLLDGLRGTEPVFGASFLAFAVTGMVYTFLSVDLRTHQHLPDNLIALILLGYGIFALLGNVVFGTLGDRVGKARAVRIGQVWEAVALVGIALLGWLGAAAWLLSIFVFGFALTQAYVPDLKALAASVPGAVRGRSVSWNNAAMFGGMMAGSALATRLYPWQGFGALTLTAAATVLAARQILRSWAHR